MRPRCASASASSSRTSPATRCWSARMSARATSRTSRTRRAGARRRRRARRAEFIDTLPQAYQTQLGKWFRDGRELSGGQWQKIALARAFMRTRADVLVLDEPTAAMDAQAEADVFEHFTQARARPHHDPHLTPLLHGAHGRSDRGARARPHHRARQPRGAHGAEWPLRASLHAAGARPIARRTALR